MSKKIVKPYSFIMMFTLCIVFEYILQSILPQIDILFSTHFLGTKSQYFKHLITIFNLINISCFSASFVYLFLLLKRKQQDQKHFHQQILTLSTYTWLGISFVLVLFHKQILFAFGINITQIQVMTPYYILYSSSIVILNLNILLSILCRSTFQMWIPIKGYLLGFIANILFNFMLYPFGFIGLGIASFLARCVTFFYLYHKNKDVISLHLYPFHLHSISFTKNFLLFTLIAIIDKLIARLGISIHYMLVYRNGIEAYRAYQLFGIYEKYSYVPLFAISFIASVSLCSSYFTKEEQLQLEKASKHLIYFFMSIFGLFLFIYAKPLAMSFSDDPQIIESCIILCRSIALLQPFAGIYVFYYTVLKTKGDFHTSLYANLIGVWVFRISIGYLLSIIFHLGILGIILPYCFDVLFKASYSAYKYHQLQNKGAPIYERNYSTTTIPSL